MATTFKKSDGLDLTIVSGSQIDKGDIVQVNDIAGVATNSNLDDAGVLDATKSVVLGIVGEFAGCKKVGGSAWAVGDAVYFDGTDAFDLSATTGDAVAGFATEIAASAAVSGTVVLSLNGTDSA